MFMSGCVNNDLRFVFLKNFLDTNFVSDITKRDIWEIEQARIIIESGAAEIVAQYITDEELTYLEILYQGTLMRGEKFDYIRFMEKDFNTFYHTENDLVANCEINYCAEAIKISLGVFAPYNKIALCSCPPK